MGLILLGIFLYATLEIWIYILAQILVVILFPVFVMMGVYKAFFGGEA